MSRLLRFEAVKDFVQETVDRGVSGVETIHRAIADIPFDVLERSGKLDERTETVRTLHHNTLASVYSTIRRVNHEVGDLATSIFEAIEDHHAARQNIARAEAGRRDEHPKEDEFDE